MRVKPVRHLPNGLRVRLIQQSGEDELEVLISGVVDHVLVQQLDHALREFESPGTYRLRAHPYGEAAKYLPVSEKWLQRRVAKNLIPHRVIGSYVRFTGEDIDEIRDSLRRGPRLTAPRWDERESKRREDEGGSCDEPDAECGR